MKNIIVPTDFSTTSVNAAYYAVEIARHIQANIVLLHVLQLPITVSEVPLPPDSYEVSMAEANQSLKELKEKLEKYSNDKVCIICKVTTGGFMGEIESLNHKQNTFAMIMGTSGAGASEAFFLGSFSLTAAKHLNHPLFVIPPGYHFNGIHKIGLACDMRNVSDTVPFPGIKDIFDHFDAKLEVLYVSKPSEKMYPQVLAETKFIQNDLARLHPEIRISTNEDIKEGLEDFVKKSGIDVLILVPKERNFVESIFHRSVSKKMVLDPEVPVMILR
ncbi:MAG: universal stress protein [Taibaiella sp.]|jgi:nucleotide-binding universal stress UspA family protein